VTESSSCLQRVSTVSKSSMPKASCLCTVPVCSSSVMLSTTSCSGDRVIRHARCPVLVVPARRAADQGPVLSKEVAQPA
jgi:hypothetical protein